jgi:hypothetical protein
MLFDTTENKISTRVLSCIAVKWTGNNFISVFLSSCLLSQFLWEYLWTSWSLVILFEHCDQTLKGYSEMFILCKIVCWFDSCAQNSNPINNYLVILLIQWNLILKFQKHDHICVKEILKTRSAIFPVLSRNRNCCNWSIVQQLLVHRLVNTFKYG